MKSYEIRTRKGAVVRSYDDRARALEEYPAQQERLGVPLALIEITRKERVLCQPR